MKDAKRKPKVVYIDERLGTQAVLDELRPMLPLVNGRPQYDYAIVHLALVMLRDQLKAEIASKGAANDTPQP